MPNVQSGPRKSKKICQCEDYKRFCEIWSARALPCLPICCRKERGRRTATNTRSILSSVRRPMVSCLIPYYMSLVGNLSKQSTFSGDWTTIAEYAFLLVSFLQCGSVFAQRVWKLSSFKQLNHSIHCIVLVGHSCCNSNIEPVEKCFILFVYSVAHWLMTTLIQSTTISLRNWWDALKLFDTWIKNLYTLFFARMPMPSAEAFTYAMMVMIKS